MNITDIIAFTGISIFGLGILHGFTFAFNTFAFANAESDTDTINTYYISGKIAGWARENRIRLTKEGNYVLWTIYFIFGPLILLINCLQGLWLLIRGLCRGSGSLLYVVLTDTIARQVPTDPENFEKWIKETEDFINSIDKKV